MRTLFQRCEQLISALFRVKREIFAEQQPYQSATDYDTHIPICIYMTVYTSMEANAFVRRSSVTHEQREYHKEESFQPRVQLLFPYQLVASADGFCAEAGQPTFVSLYGRSAGPPMQPVLGNCTKAHSQRPIIAVLPY